MQSQSVVLAVALAFAALPHTVLSQTTAAPDGTGLPQGEVSAVEPAIDPAAVSATCAESGGGCRSLVQALVAGIDAAALPPEVRQSRIALLATSVLQAASAVPPGQAASLSPVLADVLESLAEASSNLVQADTIRQIAQAVATGSTDGLPIDVAVAASPS